MIKRRMFETVLIMLLAVAAILIGLGSGPARAAAGEEAAREASGLQFSEPLGASGISLSVDGQYDLLFSLSTIQLFGHPGPDDRLWFMQIDLNYQAGITTANLGLGWRDLSAKKTALSGLNLFYDYDSTYNFSRVSLGAEYLTGLFSFRGNIYFPLSGEEELGQTYQEDGILYTYIRAVPGLDLELGLTLAPWLSLYAQGFYWDHFYSDDEIGYKFSGCLQLGPVFSVELGYVFSDETGGDYTLTAEYLWGKGVAPAPAAANPNLSSQLTQKVRREDQIKTETRTVLVPYPGGAAITITDGTNPLAGVTVSAAGNAAAVRAIQNQVTDVNGQAHFPSLAPGDYTFTAAKAGYDSNSAILTVADSEASGAIPLTRQIGHITTITVDDGTTPLPGAHVTVTVNGAEQGADTNASGQATFSNLPTDTYTFTATLTLYDSNTASVTVTDDGDDAGTIHLTRQTGGASITVTIEEPAAGVTVSVTVDGDTVTAVTDATGVATFTDLPTGTYTFSAATTGYSGSVDNVEVTDGGDTPATIYLYMVVGGASITVLDPDGNPVGSGVTVSVDINGTISVNTNASGVANFIGILEGTRTFTASPVGYRGSVDVVITNGGNTPGTINLIQIGTVQFQVNGNGLPLGGVDISVTIDGTDYSQTADGSGQATFSDLPVGTYSFFFAPPAPFPGMYFDVTISGEGTDYFTVNLFNAIK